MKKLLIMVPVIASAAGFQILEQNVTFLGQAYAGTAASVENATSAYYNPAGITENKGWNFTFSNNFLLPQTHYTLTSATVAGPNSLPVPGTEQDATNSLIPIPQLYLTKDFGKKLAFSLSLNSPFGLKTEYPLDSDVKYWSVRSHLQTINLSPGTAYKITSELSLGLGLDYSFGALLLSKYAASPINAVVDNKMYGHAWGWHFGLFYTTKQADFGLRYNSMLQYDLSGDVYPTTLASTVSTTVKSPEVVVASVNYHVTKNDNVLLDIQRTNWDRVQEIDLLYAGGNGSLASMLTTLSSNPVKITEQYKGAWRGALGYQHFFGESSILRLGVAYDQTPSNDTYRSPMIPDNDRTWLSIGWTQKWKGSSLDLGYAFVNIADAKLNFNDPLVGTLVGTWKTHVHIFGLQWNVEWS
jgi:long-chain fatty acid transport protein